MEQASLDILAVDLDGTLIQTDLLIETASLLLAKQPWMLFPMLWWLLQGRAVLKDELARRSSIDVAVLPYHRGLLRWLSERRRQGTRLYLVTASNERLAAAVADHVGLFDGVMASSRSLNLKGIAKRDALVRRFGQGSFEYVGNDGSDLVVWEASCAAHIVSSSPRFRASVRQRCQSGADFHTAAASRTTLLIAAMRPHQWMKNALIFVPLLAAHRYLDLSSLRQALLAFICFGLTASSAYLLNDLSDVNDDRHHRRKKYRPFASARLPLLWGWVLWPLLALGAFLASLALAPKGFVGSLGLYFVLTIAYSAHLKRVVLIDVVTLALLYTLRIIAGAFAIDVPLSFWLLAFSMFLFTSLAMLKRYAELRRLRGSGPGTLRGRGYRADDLELVSGLGTSSGYISVLVLALYIQDSHAASLYRHPELLWLACPVLLYWVSRAWMLSHRGEMHDDPIVFALKDHVSWGVLALLGAVALLARLVA